LDDRGEDADGVAGFFDASGGVGAFEQAGEASGEARADGHGDTVAADCGGVNPRDIIFDGEIVEEEASFEIVGAVEEEIEAGEKFFGVLRSQVGDEAVGGYGGVDGAKFLLGGDGFGKGVAGIRFVEKGLALKVGRLDKVAVDDAETADTGASEESGRRGADSAATDDYGAGSGEALLAGFADSGKENLARIAFEGSDVLGK
jgi:hypothetical protein